MSQEAVVNKRIQVTGNRSKLRTMVQIAMLSAVSAVLMMFEFPIPFLAPPFIKMDFSEIPVLVGTFAMGPLAGAVIELLKTFFILLPTERPQAASENYPISLSAVHLQYRQEFFTEKGKQEKALF